MSLYALHEAGIDFRNPVYSSGVAYLLRNQYADGSWLVKIRAYLVQLYVETGFPFGRASVDLRRWLKLGVFSHCPDIANFHENGYENRQTLIGAAIVP
jgi:hypothetical protein